MANNIPISRYRIAITERKKLENEIATIGEIYVVIPRKMITDFIYKYYDYYPTRVYEVRNILNSDGEIVPIAYKLPRFRINELPLPQETENQFHVHRILQSDMITAISNFDLASDYYPPVYQMSLAIQNNTGIIIDKIDIEKWKDEWLPS